ncbi:MAG: hypothetical protein ACXQS1_00075, partial [Methermicoccaceae archaeon]
MDYLWFLTRTVLLVVAGVVLANIIMATNVLSRLTFIIAPLCRASRLPEGCVLAIITTTLSSTAGKSALSALYRDGRLREGEVMCSIVMSTFPIVAGESLLRVQAPVAVVLLGSVGVLYIALNLLAALLQSIAALLYARVWLAPKAARREHAPDCPPTPSGGEHPSDAHEGGGVLAVGVKRSLPVLRSVLPILLLTLILAKALDVLGVMDGVGVLFSPVMSILHLPGECVAVVAAQLLHF